jgi:chorismate synthase
MYLGNLKISLFGQSHGKGIGVVIDGLPAGERIDMDALESQCLERAQKIDREALEAKCVTKVQEYVSEFINP